MLVSGEWAARKFDSLRPVIEIVGPGEISWIVKQPGSGETLEVKQLDREAAIYDLIWRTPLGATMRQCVPRLIDYDREVHALVLERKPFPSAWAIACTLEADFSAIARAIASAYACLHSLPVRKSSPSALFPTTPPWLLTLNVSTAQAAESESAQRVLEAIAADKSIYEALGKLRGEWQTIGPSHGDAKLENIVYDPTESRAWLIDWGQADYGDPAWDVGGIVQSALALWVSGMRFETEAQIAQSIDQGSINYARIVEFVRSFVGSYAVTRGLGDDPAFLLRAMKMAGARLVQTAFEHARTGDVMMKRHVAMLRLAKSALLAPEAMLAEFQSAPE